MNDAGFDQVIREGFRYGVRGCLPPDRWSQIADAIARDRRGNDRLRRYRPYIIPGAAAALLLLSLLLPPVRATAAEGFRMLWNTLWEGQVGGRPARVVTLPATETEAVAPGPEDSGKRTDVTRVATGDLDEAAALAGFAPPAVHQEGAVMREVRVAVSPLSSAGEMRVVEVVYDWNGQLYTLSAMAAFLAGEDGGLAPTPIPIPQMNLYSPPGEKVGDAEVVDLGDVEALCLQRDFGSGRSLVHCDWTMGAVRVSLNGPDLQSVVQLARTVVIP